MLLSAVSVLVVAQWSTEIPEGLMNNPVFQLPPKKVCDYQTILTHIIVVSLEQNIVVPRYHPRGITKVTLGRSFLRVQQCYPLCFIPPFLRV